MPEVIIKYKNKKTLEALADFAKYFDFSITFSTKEKREKTSHVHGVTIVRADSSIDTSDLETIFSNKNIDSKQLRGLAWQRTK